MRYCRNCVNPDTRPNSTFSESGLCPVCQHHLFIQQNPIDWEARRLELENLLAWGRANSNSTYDCIVTVSGGKDSTRQALHVRDKMGYNPLLVSCVYPPEQLNERGAANLANLANLGFDILSVSLNPVVWKRMVVRAFQLYANLCKATELALFAIPIHTAIATRIPLVFLGENPAITIGEEQGVVGGDAFRMKYSNTLKGGRPDELMTEGITSQDVHFYAYPSDEEMERGKLRIYCLGHYIEDFWQYANGVFAVQHGLEVRSDPPERIGDIWGFTGLDEDFRIVNQMIKRIKLGFGHVTDQVCESINRGLMTREQGIDYVMKYDGKCAHEFIEKFCHYLGMDETEFWRIVNTQRNMNIWKMNSNGEFQLVADLRGQ